MLFIAPLKLEISRIIDAILPKLLPDFLGNHILRTWKKMVVHPVHQFRAIENKLSAIHGAKYIISLRFQSQSMYLFPLIFHSHNNEKFQWTLASHQGMKIQSFFLSIIKFINESFGRYKNPAVGSTRPCLSVLSSTSWSATMRFLALSKNWSCWSGSSSDGEIEVLLAAPDFFISKSDTDDRKDTGAKKNHALQPLMMVSASSYVVPDDSSHNRLYVPTPAKFKELQLVQHIYKNQ